jgi:energy-coupling factor transporter ATP-binding protein EcfA2
MLRRGQAGRSKLLGHCLFHDDSGRPNADFYPDDGWYKCWACAEVYSVEDVASKLGIAPNANEARPSLAEPRRMLTPTASTNGYHTKFGHPSATYSYYFPDGRLSHRKYRYVLEGGGKTFLFQTPDGLWKRPESFWPIYGPNRLPSGMNFILLEGEKAQECVTAAMHLHQGIPIFAFTMGAAAEMQNSQNRKLLVQHLQFLNPNRVLVWPDNDKPGQEWARPLHQQLLSAGIRAAYVDIRQYALPDHAGCDDFLDQDGDLDAVFVKEFQQAGGFAVDEVVKEIIVTKNGQFLMPGTRNLRPIKDELVEVAIYRMTKDSTPPPKIRQRVRNELRAKSEDSGIEVFHRRWHDHVRSAFAWRSLDHGYAYYVDQTGIRTIQDPPNSLLVLPPGQQFFEPTVELSGDRRDLERLIDFFGADTMDMDALECWLLSSLMGLQTPVLMLRGEAGSGKTTLARALVGVLEPTVPQIPFSRNGNQDQRALLGSLAQSMAIVIDNVSHLPPETEDLLCQFVTGFSTPYRRLYEDKVENLSMQRAIAITTTNWNIAKGDLVSRLIGLRLRPRERYKDEIQVDALLNQIIPRVRGYLFRRAQFYYQYVAMNPNGASSIRLSSIGKIGRALGYDMERLEQHIAFNRSRIAGETDVWYNAVVEWYRDLGLVEGEERQVKLEEIKGSIEGITDQFLPSNNKFAMFLYEAESRFRDLGFTIQRGRTNQQRFWTIKCNRKFEDWGDE